MIWLSLVENSASAAVIQVYVLIAICQEPFVCGQIARLVLKGVLGQQVNVVLALEVQVKLELH